MKQRQFIFFIRIIVLTIFTSITMLSCKNDDSALTAQDKAMFEIPEVHAKDIQLSYRDTVYVPIYSDLNSDSKYVTYNLTATLSIRNTSLTDSMYVEAINFYNTDGDLISKYINRTLILRPMQSIEYTIDRNKEMNKTGSNFIVKWGAKTADLNPVIQGVKISTDQKQGISLITNGISISRRNGQKNNQGN